MGKLNAPREIDYDFRVVEFCQWVWLYDDSERIFPCTSTPHVHIEALYWNGDEDDDPGYLPEPGVLTVAQLKDLPTGDIPVECPMTMKYREAWDEAREEASANHQL